MAGAYDARNGGLGGEPKFTNPSILRLILHLQRATGEDFYAAMLRKTLDAMADSPMFDDVDGGFFRYSTAANWSEPQREKMLEDNIQLASLYLDASIILSKNDQTESYKYREVAERTFSYVNNFLYDSDLADSTAARGRTPITSPLTARSASRLPYLLRIRLAMAALDAIAAAALLDASWKVEGRLGEHLGKVGRDVISRLEGMAAAGTFSRVYPEDNPGESSPLLADWAGLLAGLMQAHASTAEPRYLDRAVDVARVMVDRFFDEQGGGFFDIEADE